jgi:hypothetical protein
VKYGNSRQSPVDSRQSTAKYKQPVDWRSR